MATTGALGPNRTSRLHSNQESGAESTGQQPTTASGNPDPERNPVICWNLTALRAIGALDIPGQDCTRGDLHRIHPLLKRTTFEVSTDVYARIAPALCVASAFLYEPQASVFWYSLAFADKRPIPHFYTDAQGIRSVAPSDPWSQFSAVSVGVNEWRELETFWQQMALALTIRFADTGVASGQTQPMKWRRSYPPGQLLVSGQEALINLSYDLRTLARSFATPVPTESLPYWLRQHHYLAVTVLHEICHAIHVVRSQVDSEPFFEDQRQAELGFAWEQSVLNGQMYPTAEQKFYLHDTIYGLQFERWPEYWKDDNAAMFEKWPLDEDDDPVRATSRRHWSTRYPVTMEYVQSIAMRRTWEEVARDGPELLQMPKTYGLRKGWTGWNAWQHAGSSGYSSQFDSEPHEPSPEGSHDLFRVVRRLSTPSDDDATDVDAADSDPMDIDDPEDDANRRKRSSTTSISSRAGGDLKRRRSSSGTQAGRDAKRPRLSIVAKAPTGAPRRGWLSKAAVGRGPKRA